MNERRSEQRLLCADLVDVRWRDASGRSRRAVANLEDISLSGVCIQLDIDIPLGTELRIKYPAGEFVGHVRYCTFREIGLLRRCPAGRRQQVVAQRLPPAAPARPGHAHAQARRPHQDRPPPYRRSAEAPRRRGRPAASSRARRAPPRPPYRLSESPCQTPSRACAPPLSLAWNSRSCTAGRSPKRAPRRRSSRFCNVCRWCCPSCAC